MPLYWSYSQYSSITHVMLYLKEVGNYGRGGLLIIINHKVRYYCTKKSLESKFFPQVMLKKEWFIRNMSNFLFIGFKFYLKAFLWS